MTKLIQLPERPKGLKFDIPRVAGGRLEVHALAGAPTLDIFDAIGDGGATAAGIAGALNGVTGDLTVRINSPGGDYFEGLAIYNMLRAHQGAITVQVMGYAASAASVIAMAGDDIQIARTAEIMVHQAWGMAIGNADVMDEVSTLLRRVDDTLVDIYAERTGRPAADIRKLVQAETWMKGPEAVAAGFADGLLEQQAMAKLEARTISANSRQELEETLRTVGFARGAAKKIAAAAWPALTNEPALPLDAVAAKALLREVHNEIFEMKAMRR